MFNYLVIRFVFSGLIIFRKINDKDTKRNVGFFK